MNTTGLPLAANIQQSPERAIMKDRGKWQQKNSSIVVHF